VQPVIAIIEKEYALLKGDDLHSMSYGVPARIGPYGVEKIYELDVAPIRKELDRSADIIKEDIKIAAGLLKEKFGIV
jgi:malate/lactate dehydrogenase